MVSKNTTKLALIFACIALHFFNGAGLFYSHPFPHFSFHFDHSEVNFLETSIKLSFLTRIAGGYYLGKIADKFGFFKTMKAICLIYAFVSLVLSFFYTQNTFEGAVLLCLVNGILTFLLWSSLILPVMYIFQHYQKPKRYVHSAIAWNVALFGIMMIDLCVLTFTDMHCFNWSIVYAASAILNLIIYSYIETFPEAKIQKTAEMPVSKQAILLAFLLAGVCGAGATYQYYSVEHYFTNVLVLKTSAQQVIYSPFWITLFLTFIPVAQLTKNLKIIKIIQLSLCGMLSSVSLFYIFPVNNYFMLFAHQVIYAISFGLFLPPALRFIYRLLQGYNSFFI